MRKLILILFVILFTELIWAVVPQRISYQAVIHNENNKLATNTAVKMRISILSETVSGEELYVETQTPTTNENGLASIEIGGGNIVSGIFANINWATGTYFIKTETDPTGGSNYIITETTQIISVPYALYAKTAESITGTMISQQVPTATLLTASNLQTISATLNGTVNGKGLSTSVFFEWGLTTGYGNTVQAIQSPIIGSSTVTVSTNITGLQSATTYNYRIKAVNAVNVTYSNNLTFRTL